MKKLIPAFCLLLVAATLFTTSTFAWFSMNSKVSVTGMRVRAQVSDNLYIAKATGAGTSAMPGSNDYYAQDVQSIDALLEPVSTVDGKTFYWADASKVKADGDTMVDDQFKRYDDAAAASFNSNYGTTGAVPYTEYINAIKGSNTGDSDVDIYLTAANLMYGGLDDKSEKTFRLAIFVQDAGETGTAAQTDMHLIAILAPDGAAYLTASATTYNVVRTTAGVAYNTDAALEFTLADSTKLYAAYDDANTAAETVTKWYSDAALSTDVTKYVTLIDGATPEKPEGTVAAASVAVSDTGKFAAVQKLGETVKIGTVEAGKNHYYKVVSRLWLEGEDSTCKNDTFAVLNDTWMLDMKFEQGVTTGVNELAQDKATEKIEVKLGTSPVAADAAPVIVGANSYYKYVINGATYYADKAVVDSETRFYTIDGNIVIEVTGEFVLYVELTTLSVTDGVADKVQGAKIDSRKDFVITFTPATGYVQPESVTVTGATGTWNKNTGTYTIPAAQLTTDLTITYGAVSGS